MYAGDVTPEHAHAAVLAGEGLLVDVRTRAEWAYVGVPDTHTVFIEWQSYPDGARNGSFVEELRAAGAQEGRPLYFLCRSGARSAAAAKAATADGLGPAFNIIDGFEGPLDGAGRRVVGGWRNVGLPWKQS